MLIASDGEDRYVQWLARVLLLLPVESKTDSVGIEYLFPQYMKCTPALDAVDMNLGCLYQRWSTTDEDDHRAVRGEEQMNRTELNAVSGLE